MPSSPWQYVRAWFARVGSDPYYANYDRTLSNIKAEVERLQAARAARRRAWAHIRARFLGSFAAAYAVVLGYAAYINHRPLGTYTTRQQAVRVLPAFLAPLAAWLVYRLMGWLQRLLDRRSAARVQLLQAKLRKQVAELKDSTRYERTLALIQKYDPDYAPPKPPRPASAGRIAGQQLQGKAVGAAGGGPAVLPAPVSRAAGAAVNVAGSALQGAGAAIGPVLSQLYTRAAGSLIADDPIMISLMREAQQQSDILRQRLLLTEAHAVQLQRDKIHLKQQLGLPTEEEEVMLAAWLVGGMAGPNGGGTTAAAGAGPGAEDAAAQQQQGAPMLALPAAVGQQEGEDAAGVAAARGPAAEAAAAADQRAAQERQVLEASTGNAGSLSLQARDGSTNAGATRRNKPSSGNSA